MSMQQITFYAGIALVAIGVVLLGMAAYLYFARNIPDIRDDLSGKKRAEAIANMEAPGTGVLKRKAHRAKSNRAKEQLLAGEPSSVLKQNPPTSGSQTGGSTSESVAQAESKSTPQPQRQTHEVAAPIPQLPDSDETTVLGDDAPATTVMGVDESATQTAVAERSDVPQESVAPEPAEVEEKEPEAEHSTVEEPTTAGYLPEDYYIIQKIVLLGSADYVRTGQGDRHE